MPVEFETGTLKKPQVENKYAKTFETRTGGEYRSFSLSRNKKINREPSGGRSQENEML